MSASEFLSRVSGFTTIGRGPLKRISERAEEVSFEAGQTIFSRGEPGQNMLVIRQGRVRIPLLDEDGETKLLVHLGAGDIVGEMALLTGEPRSADVVADTEVTALSLDRSAVIPMLEDQPDLASFLTEILASRLEQSGGIDRVGKYRLFGKLGEGATSKVYEGLHPDLGRSVAVKMLSHELVFDARFRDRFLEEARMVAGLTHPNIVQVYDTETRYGTCFIVMEKLIGTDLEEVLLQRGRLPVDEVCDILRQLAAALAYAHGRGLVHGDVKPANTAILDDGTVKLVDFGIARPMHAEGSASGLSGTPAYIPPEVVKSKPVDGRADIYSLGVMAFEMITGCQLFQRSSLEELLTAHVLDPPDLELLPDDLPSGLQAFVEGSLVKNPEDRLSDWARIDRLLSGDTAGTNAVPLLHEKVVRIRYAPGTSRQVERLVSKMKAQLVALSQVDVAVAALEGDASSGELVGVQGDATKAGAGRPRSGSGWFNRITGAFRASPGEGEP